MKNVLIKNGSDKYYGQLTLLDDSVVNVKSFNNKTLIFTNFKNINSTDVADKYVINELTDNVPSDVDDFINNQLDFEFYSQNTFFLCEEIMFI